MCEQPDAILLHREAEHDERRSLGEHKLRRRGREATIRGDFNQRIVAEVEAGRLVRLDYPELFGRDALHLHCQDRSSNRDVAFTPRNLNVYG